MSDPVVPSAPLRDVTKLVWPFPEKVIQKNPSGGGSYVAHPLVEQRLIDVLGHPPTTELVHFMHGMVAAKAADPNGSSARARAGSPQLDNAVVGVVLRMTCVIDGHEVTVEEVGDCEDPHNWKTDGQRAKDAFSDAYKRCAMRLGVGLHLWTKEPQKNYYIAQKFAKADDEAGAQVPEVPDSTPIETTATEHDEPEPAPLAASEADDSGPGAASEPPSDPEPPRTDWKGAVRQLGLPESIALATAREVAAERGVRKPVSLKQVEWSMEDGGIGEAFAWRLVKATEDVTVEGSYA